MSIGPIKPGAALDTPRAALMQLRALAALPSADLYAHSAEQVEAIVAGLESRTTASGLIPDPLDPG